MLQPDSLGDGMKVNAEKPSGGGLDASGKRPSVVNLEPVVVLGLGLLGGLTFALLADWRTGVTVLFSVASLFDTRRGRLCRFLESS